MHQFLGKVSIFALKRIHDEAIICKEVHAFSMLASYTLYIATLLSYGANLPYNYLFGFIVISSLYAVNYRVYNHDNIWIWASHLALKRARIDTVLGTRIPRTVSGRRPNT
jgi:hypothetical protein